MESHYSINFMKLFNFVEVALFIVNIYHRTLTLFMSPSTAVHKRLITRTSNMIDESKYTQEQKIVSAVWVHEKPMNRMSWKDIENNFRARFCMSPPTRTTFLKWEKRLFTEGTIDDRERSGRPLSRLMHVPYVKASLKESPELSLRERAQELGLPRTTLFHILRKDLNMEFEVDDEDEQKKLAKCKGKWKKKEKGESSKSVKEEENVEEEK